MSGVCTSILKRRLLPVCPRIALVEISSGRVVSKVKLDGAKFLNDAAVESDGTVYVSDTLLSRIYAIKEGKASVFEMIGRPPKLAR